MEEEKAKEDGFKKKPYYTAMEKFCWQTLLSFQCYIDLLV